MSDLATQAQIDFPDGTCLKVGATPAAEAFKSTWTQAYQNKLPDSAFLFIESGGEKDDEGKTKPRSKRHFPVRDADGKLDADHVRDAIGRIPQSDAPGLNAAKKKSLQEKARKLLESTQEKTEKSDFEYVGRILKADEPEGTKLHYVLHVALEPNPPEDGVTSDTQKDAYGEADVWEAQRSFQESRVTGLRHLQVAKGVRILHDWITPVDFDYGGQRVIKGSWLLGHEIDENDDDGAKLWKGIQSGEINALSIGGVGDRVPLE